VFAKGSAFAKFGAASAKPGEGGPLAGLPSGPFAIAAGGVIAERTAHGLANLSVSMLKTIAKDLPAEKLQKLEQAYALSMKGMRGMGMLLQVGKEDEPLLASMVAVIRTDDATKYLADYEQSLKNINEVLKDLPLPFVPSYDLKTVKAGKLSALEMTMDLGALIPPDDEVRKMLDKAFGAGGKITASLAALDSKTVIMRYTPVAGLSEIIKTAKSKALAMDPEVVKTAALLPAGAQWALYVSPKGVTDLANRSLKLFGAPNEVPGFAATPPAAAGLKLSEGGIELRVVLPAAVLEQVGPYLGKLQTLRLQ